MDNSFYVGTDLSIVYVGCGPLPGTIWILLFLEACLPTTTHTQSIRNCWMIRQKISGKNPLKFENLAVFQWGDPVYLTGSSNFHLYAFGELSDIPPNYSGLRGVVTFWKQLRHTKPICWTPIAGTNKQQGSFYDTNPTHALSNPRNPSNPWHTFALFDPPRMGKFYDPWTTQIPSNTNDVLLYTWQNNLHWFNGNKLKLFT